jgi:cytochrome c biogenesis protein CcdA
MSTLLIAAFSALWLGILTSISPCPLATNIAAISYLGKQAQSTKSVFAHGLLYTIGRTVTYVSLAVIAVTSILSLPQLSFFLQRYMGKLMGPILIVVGLVLLEFVRPPSFGLSADKKFQALGERGGAWGAGALGMLFALSFCPTSAGLFFGTLIPLAIDSKSVVVLPGLYGLGTALPVFAFAVLIALGAKSVATVFQRLSALEVWARRITGVVFILIGFYFCWTYIWQHSDWSARFSPSSTASSRSAPAAGSAREVRRRWASKFEAQIFEAY